MKETRQLAKYLAHLGYGSRKEMEAAIRRGRVTGEGDDLRFDGEPLDPPPGCHFHPRCPHATERCKMERPALREIAPKRWSAWT